MIYQFTKSYKNQQKLAKYCKTGEYYPIEGVRERHVEQYRRLVYNIVKDSLATAYPLTLKLLPQDEWDNMLDFFWKENSCQSTQIWTMPKEFYAYMKLKDMKVKEQYPFLEELLWFEWLEIFYFMREDVVSIYPIIEKKEFLTNQLLVINPELSVEFFAYPVFKKSAADITVEDKSNYFLCVYRKPTGDREVIYTELSITFVRLVELLQQSPMSTLHATQQLCDDLSINMTDTVLDNVHHFVSRGLESELLLGVTNLGG